MKDMKLGLQLGYWGAGPPANAAQQVAEAERLGFDSIWTAEAYGSDALTPLAWWVTDLEDPPRHALCQLSARTPTAMGMAAITLDHLSGGRFVLGLGVSGPQVVEGWYGQSFEKPFARTREYMDIVRQVVARRRRSIYDGAQYQLPYPGGTGLGKAPQAHRPSDAAVDPHLVGRGRTKERGPGGGDRRRWLPICFSPKHKASNRPWPRGSLGPGPGMGANDFEVSPPRTIVDDDIELAADLLQPSWPSTSAAWGQRRRTSTTTCSCGWATKPRL